MTWKFWVAAIIAIGLPAFLFGSSGSGGTRAVVALLLAPAVIVGAVTFRRAARKAEANSIVIDDSLRSRSGIKAACTIVVIYMVGFLVWSGPALWHHSNLSDRGMVMLGAMIGVAGVITSIAGIVAYMFGTGTGQRV